MEIFDELKKCKDFVYFIKNKYYIIGYAHFLECSDDLKDVYNNFIKLVKNLKVTLEIKPSEEKLDDCIALFEELTSTIAKIVYNMNNDENNYNNFLCNLNENLEENEKINIKNQRKLFVLFDDLQSKKEKIKDFNVDYIDLINKLKEIDL